MLKELKAKSLKSVMIPVIILLAVGIGMFVYNGFGVFKLIGGPKYLYDLPVDELNGSYVEAEIFYLPDWYAVTESRREGSPVKTVVSREYIIPVGDMEFMGVLMNKENTVRCAGGFIVQVMPFVTEEVLGRLEENIQKISSVTTMLDNGHTPEEMLE